MAKSKYYSRFDIVEVQDTFYEPPRIATLEKWRAEAPPGFTFVLKAWQVITHSATSPTYRRLKSHIAESDKSGCGSFHDSSIVQEAWDKTFDCAVALRASGILFQCPASFTPSAENQRNIRAFFSRIKRPQGTRLFWEPRGEWDPALIRSLCNDCDLGHVVDPFVNESVTPSEIYFRLHGKTGWRYTYSQTELKEIVKRITTYRKAKIFFNNVSMISDAQRFKILVEEK